MSDEMTIAELTLDGNAVGGVLAQIFGADITGHHGRCAHCGTISVMATMRAYVGGPGIVLRCPTCGQVVIRVVQTPSGTRLDARGAAYLAIDEA